MPKRIQRRRIKGWRMPAEAVYVGRPTKWGNPFKVGAPHPNHGWPMSPDETVALFRKQAGNPKAGWVFRENVRSELRGKDLVCWCSLDRVCHADALLEFANL